MIIEFSNTIEAKSHSTVAMAIVISACALFFIPTTLIILGYYTSQPTGSLVSPLPQGTLSQQPVASPTPASATPTPEVNNQPLIAAPNEASSSSESATSEAGSNVIDKVATIPAGETEITVTDPDVAEASQIYLSPRQGDKALYSLRSKMAGSFIIAVSAASDSSRSLDYHIANP